MSARFTSMPSLDMVTGSAAKVEAGTITMEFSESPLLLAEHIDTLALNIRSFREPLTRAIREVVIPSIRNNFDSGGDPSWQPLARITLDQKLRAGFSPDILVRSGKLKRVAQQLNIWTINREEAYITSLPVNVWYGQVHQAGTRKIPSRPFIAVTSTDEDRIREVFSTWLEERVVRKWGERL